MCIWHAIQRCCLEEIKRYERFVFLFDPSMCIEKKNNNHDKLLNCRACFKAIKSASKLSGPF